MKRTPISYNEEGSAQDRYIYCDKCTEFVYDYCSIHGPLLVIPDDEVPPKTNHPSFVPRAALTIPHVFLHLAPSIIPGAGLGVFSTLTLPCGVRFGPYRGRRSNEISSMYCWQVYDRNHKLSHVIDAGDTSKSNWMRYVNCARHWREQNLVAYQYQGQLYYRTIKTIPRYTELMVFYGIQFANQMQIDIQRYMLEEYYERIIGPSRVPKKNGQSVEIIKLIEAEDKVSKFHENMPNFTSQYEISHNDFDYSLMIEDKTIQTNKVTYKDFNQLKIHSKNIKKTKHKCYRCEKVLSSKDSLRKHLLIHADIKKFNCLHCNYKTSIKYNLSRHTRRQHKIMKCDVLRT